MYQHLDETKRKWTLNMLEFLQHEANWIIIIISLFLISLNFLATLVYFVYNTNPTLSDVSHTLQRFTALCLVLGLFLFLCNTYMYIFFCFIDAQLISAHKAAKQKNTHPDKQYQFQTYKSILQCVRAQIVRLIED